MALSEWWPFHAKPTDDEANLRFRAGVEQRRNFERRIMLSTTMSQPDMQMLSSQQIGEILSGLQGLRDSISIRHAQSEQLHDLLRSDLAMLRRDHRDLEEKLDCVVFVSQNDMGKLRSHSVANAAAIQSVLSVVNALKVSVEDILSFKSKLAGLLFALGALGSCVLWLSEPVYRWFVEAALQH